MRRWCKPLLAAGALPVLTALPASAAKPQFIGPERFTVEIPFPDVCPDFEMVATVTGYQHTINFVDSSGEMTSGFLGGHLTVTWTRLDTDFSLTINISGPSFQDASNTAVRGAGRWTTPLEGTGWVLAIGHLTMDGTQDGFALIQSYRGQVTPLCDLMEG